MADNASTSPNGSPQAGQTTVTASQAPHPGQAEAQSTPPPLNAPSAAPAYPQQASQQVGAVLNTGLKQGMDQLKNMDVKKMFAPKQNQTPVTTDEKLWGMVSYLPMVALLALLIKPNSAYIRLHGRQGLLIFLVFFFCIFVYLFPVIGPMLGALAQFVLFLLGIYGCYQAFIGNWWKIPVLGDLAELIPLGLFMKVTHEVMTGQPSSEQALTQPNPSQENPHSLPTNLPQA